MSEKETCKNCGHSKKHHARTGACECEILKEMNEEDKEYKDEKYVSICDCNSFVPNNNFILALIHNDNLSVDEAIEATYFLTIKMHNLLYDTQSYTINNEICDEFVDYVNYNKKPISLSTTHSLTDLKKKFEEKGMVCEIEEKKGLCINCGCQLSEHELSTAMTKYHCRSEKCHKPMQYSKCRTDILTDKMMLAVFGREKEIREMV